MKNAGRSLLLRFPAKDSAAIAPAIANGIFLEGGPSFRACDAVATVTVTGALADPVGRATETGFTVQVVPTGAQARSKIVAHSSAEPHLAGNAVVAGGHVIEDAR